MEHKVSSPEEVRKMKRHRAREVYELAHFARLILGDEALDKAFEMGKEWDEFYYPIHELKDVYKELGIE
jgi:hypothetical protein